MDNNNNNILNLIQKDVIITDQITDNMMVPKKKFKTLSKTILPLSVVNSSSTTTPTTIPLSSTQVQSVHSSTSSKDKKEPLLPILDYRFNLREICKQIVLLEDHIVHKRKRCIDCCYKHWLTIEALAEEMLTLHSSLDPGDENYELLVSLPDKIRELQKSWKEDVEKNALSTQQELRKLRKQFMEPYFDIIFNVKGGCSVASLEEKK